ncbi:uncharacterized protein LOC101771078 isoform X3 [Setaria italica]|uniref:uncharacterized protein LOC101771078 isoform X3 n=1 Tax=Setaria italica TaxID=4555 RepID=UPI000BE59442|nr:uncharacterized protein LOC101771078 isoform X3 [Setaria italica]
MVKRKMRLAELREAAKAARFGSLVPITGSDFVREEEQGEPDPKLKIIERPVEDGDEEKTCGGGGGEEEKNGGRGDTVDEEDSEDDSEEDSEDDSEEDSEEDSEDDSEDDSEEDMRGWDEEDGNPYLPVKWPWEYPLHICPEGQKYTLEEAKEIVESTWERNGDLLSEWSDLFNNNTTPLPALPLRVLPRVTKNCVSGDDCYHVQYWIGDTDETALDHPYFIPCEMMQVFSLGLSSPLARPINIYGHFSVRDAWEPLRNYLFNRSRNDPAMISQGCSFLPLCSPCRGIYVCPYFLMDVNLWIKEEEGSPDTPLFSGYVEIDTSFAGFGSVLIGRFQGEVYGVNMIFALLGNSIETVIEVNAEAEQPSDVRISASTSGFDEEISLYDGKFCGSGSMFKHIVAVKKQEELHVVLKMNESTYKWTFKAGIGVVIAPEHPVSGFTQYFVMNVSFRTKGKAASAWQWSCICNDVRVSRMCL